MFKTRSLAISLGYTSSPQNGNTTDNSSYLRPSRRRTGLVFKVYCLAAGCTTSLYNIIKFSYFEFKGMDTPVLCSLRQLQPHYHQYLQPRPNHVHVLAVIKLSVKVDSACVLAKATVTILACVSCFVPWQ